MDSNHLKIITGVSSMSIGCFHNFQTCTILTCKELNCGKRVNELILKSITDLMNKFEHNEN